MKDNRLLALILFIPPMILLSASVAFGYVTLFILLLLGAGALFIFLLYPEMPMTIFFPLMWLFWQYNLPLIGGRLERVIGVLAIAGVAFALLFRRRTLLALPPLVTGGLALLFVAYSISGVINFTPIVQDNIISLAMRILFLYLAYFHLHTSRQLRLAGGLLIATGLAGAIFILILNLQWGLGFFRTGQGLLLAQTALGSFWFSLLSGGNSLTIPAVLLLGIYPSLRRLWQRYLVLAASGFLFSMAFLAQFRREILITVAVVLIYMIVVNFGGIRRVAIMVLVGLAVFYMLVLQPSAIFQQRLAETAMVAEGTDPRLISLKAGLQAFQESPIIGTGPGSYERAAYGVLGSGYPSFYYHAYNVFIYFAVESGLLGLIGLLITFFAVFRQVRQRTENLDSPEGWILRSAPVLLLVIMVSFLFGNYYDMSLPWYLMGMMLSASRLAGMPALQGNK